MMAPEKLLRMAERFRPADGVERDAFDDLFLPHLKILCLKYSVAESYRIPREVIPYKLYAGKCPTCGAVFLDDKTRYCGNCGQAIAFPEVKK